METDGVEAYIRIISLPKAITWLKCAWHNICIMIVASFFLSLKTCNMLPNWIDEERGLEMKYTYMEDAIKDSFESNIDWSLF